MNSLKKLSVLPVLLICLGITFSGCKPRKPKFSYNYLLKDKTPPKASPAPTPPPADERIAEDSGNPPVPKAEEAIKAAESYLGTPYKYGGTSKSGMDCSGLVCTSYKAAGIGLPRNSADQSNAGTHVSRSQIQAGDLVCFSARNSGRIDHVGLVTEVKGKAITFIHATSSNGVRYDRLDVGYWQPRFRRARRVAP